jgi:hypothetical protein
MSPLIALRVEVNSTISLDIVWGSISCIVTLSSPAFKRQGIADTNCNVAMTPGDCGVVGVDPAAIVAILIPKSVPCHMISKKSAAANWII